MKRPVGISILSILYFLSGLALLVIQIGWATQLSKGFESVGFSAIVAQAGVGFLALLGLGAGFGMWTAKRWGWWLGSFYLTYSVARNVSALIALPGLLESAGAVAGEGTKHYIKFGGRIVFHSLICWYFFTPRVEQYFQVTDVSRKKRVGQLVGATAAVATFFGVLNAIF